MVDDEGSILEGAARRQLVITRPWPGQMRTVYGDHQRFIDTYFCNLSRVCTLPVTAHGAMKMAITGLPVASTMCSMSPATAWVRPKLKARWCCTMQVAEAAVVGYPHDIKGQGIYAYVTLIKGVEPTDELQNGTGQTGA